MRNRMYGGLLALGMMVFGANGVSAQCSSFISGGPGNPVTGSLIGTATLTQEISGGISSPIASLEGKYSIEYEVGFYKMSNGTYMAVNCFNYQQM